MRNCVLCVENLGYFVTDDQLKILFSDYGKLKRIKLYRDEGVGIVEMMKTEDAENAINELNNFLLDGENIRVHKLDEHSQTQKHHPRRIDRSDHIQEYYEAVDHIRSLLRKAREEREKKMLTYL